MNLFEYFRIGRRPPSADTAKQRLQLVIAHDKGSGGYEFLPLLQRELLASAIRLTRPGGVVLYATCSPHLAETVGVVADALRRQPVTALDARALFAPVEEIGPGPYVQLWPHRHGTDAMFAAALQVR